ncbi:MAG: GNAT family N-acetyltransferase [Candidatus Limnocylindrales bacterium]
MTDAAAGPRRWTAGIIRPMQVADLPDCADVFYAALDELYARIGRPPLPHNPEPMIRLFGHLLETDPGRCHVAETGSGVVAFGIAHRRASTWFLSFLFVRPEQQSAGLGRQLTMRCLAEGDGGVDGTGALPSDGLLTHAVCAEAIQPVSLALYASLGMRPRVPILLLTGKPGPDLRVGDPTALEAIPFAELAAADHRTLAASVDAIDLATLGYEHPQDHRFLARSGRQGWLFRERATGESVGYGYAQPSGRLGPVATTDARWLSSAVAHLFGAVTPTDGWQLHVPGPSPLLPLLLRGGFRLDGDAPILWSATSDGPDFERYLLGSYAVL